ncbi:uncharacterized protein LOC113679808 [Pocillopora damicornis]|nr:uncharacterized protein LOC113679808 [Pocillopora damicornis]
MSISGGQHTFYLYTTELATSDDGFVGNSTFKFHQLTVGSTYRFWSAVSNKNGGVMKRSPSENIVICGGTFEEPDDTHIQVIDVNNKSPNKSNAVALLFTDTKLNKQYAMKGIGCGQEIQTEEISLHDDESDIFEPDYFWSYTMLKHVKTGCYVGCDYTGKVTLVENSKPEFPNAEILFIANAP